MKYGKLNVTQQHIDSSECRVITTCAISTAIMEDPMVKFVGTYYLNDGVISIVIYQDNSYTTFIFSKEARRFIGDFDADKRNVKPIMLEYRDDKETGFNLMGGPTKIKKLHDTIINLNDL